jgi:hypothetical protein
MTQPVRPLETTDAAACARTRFVNDAARAEACARLEAERALLVKVEINVAARSRLADRIDEAIERELDARGAAPPGIGATSDADAALSDQLFRARRVGALGIALSLGPMRAATNALAAIEPEDCATLRFWTAATKDRPVWVLLDAEDAVTGAYAEPVPLAALLADEPAAHEDEDDDEPAVESGPIALPSSTDLIEPIDPTPTDVIAVALATPEVAPAPEPEPVAPLVEAPAVEPPPVEAKPEEPTPPRRGRARPTPLRAATPTPIAAVTSDEWRTWALALSAARGPQPLAAFERLFGHDYMPLANAVAAGLDDPRALQAVDDFRRTFARAYSEACPTFAVTGKRPRMVLDAPEVAAKIARLHGARSTQILLVDGMRQDVGARIRDQVRAQLGSRASLTDEVVLWSALPTTTGRQIETLGRGVEALRVAPSDTDRDAEPLRGRTADVIRRVRVGSRDLYKLDAVEARVRENGTDCLVALPFIADAAADAIARHAATLQPRTLLFVFGDHGFTIDRDGAARQGGASPEEVLVPGFAFLVGEVH